jgi:hypothetical protein
MGDLLAAPLSQPIRKHAQRPGGAGNKLSFDLGPRHVRGRTFVPAVIGNFRNKIPRIPIATLSRLSAKWWKVPATEVMRDLSA